MEKSKSINYESDQHSIFKSLALSLIPGFLITLVMWISTILLSKGGLPGQIAIYIPTLLIVLPFELGYLLYLGKRRNGRYSLDGIVLFRSSIPVRQNLVFVIAFTAWNFLVFYLMAPLEKLFAEKLFYWMPSGLLPSPDPISDLSLLTAAYPKYTIILGMIIGLLLNGITTPLVEELYFRGFLLPRLSYLKHWAPVLNVLFFSIYHIFSPWKYLTIILALLPAVYIVWKKRSVYLTIITHIALNTISLASSIIYLLLLS